MHRVLSVVLCTNASQFLSLQDYGYCIVERNRNTIAYTLKSAMLYSPTMVGLYIMVVTYYGLSAYHIMPSQGSAYLSSVSYGQACGQNFVPDTARCQVVEHGMIWHIENTVIVLHWCGTVQDRPAEE